MVKELHLVARTLYTIVAMFAFSGVTGLGLSEIIIVQGIIVFANSFVFQYYCLHYILKKIAVVRTRVLFLLAWIFVCLAGIVGASFMIPHISEIDTFRDTHEFVQTSAIWGSVFIAFCAAFVAATCTRRAFSKHGALG